MHTGSCLCGAVEFEVEGNFQSFFLCHCSYCRKDTGSAHAANLFAQQADFRWISGKDKVTCYELPSTRHTKSFCSLCGSALPRMEMDGRLLVVPAGSLDSRIDVTPNAHIFVASRAGWDDRLDQLPMIEGAPDATGL